MNVCVNVFMTIHTNHQERQPANKEHIKKLILSFKPKGCSTHEGTEYSHMFIYTHTMVRNNSYTRDEVNCMIVAKTTNISIGMCINALVCKVRPYIYLLSNPRLML